MESHKQASQDTIPKNKAVVEEAKVASRKRNREEETPIFEQVLQKKLKLNEGYKEIGKKYLSYIDDDFRDIGYYNPW